MHEMSIAVNLVEIMSSLLREHGGAKPLSTTVKVGCLTGVIEEPLEMAFRLVAEEQFGCSPVLIVESIPVSGRCLDCGAVFEFTVFPTLCPICESINIDPSGGRELELVSLGVEGYAGNHYR